MDLLIRALAAPPTVDARLAAPVHVVTVAPIPNGEGADIAGLRRTAPNPNGEGAGVTVQRRTLVEATLTVNQAATSLQPVMPSCPERQGVPIADFEADPTDSLRPSFFSLQMQDMLGPVPDAAAPDSPLGSCKLRAKGDTLSPSVDASTVPVLPTPVHTGSGMPMPHVLDNEQDVPAAATTDGTVVGPLVGATEAQKSVGEMLADIVQPVTPGVIPTPRSPHTPPGPPCRATAKAKNTIATRRSHRNRKQVLTGSGNKTMMAARKLIISKRGLAIAEKGEVPEDAALANLSTALNSPLSGAQMGALSILTKGASRRGRSAAVERRLVSPSQ